MGTVTSDAGGNWRLAQPSSSPLSDGSHYVTAQATDSNGNTSPSSSRNSFTVDTVPVRYLSRGFDSPRQPAAPIISSPADGAILSMTRPTISGTGEPLARISILIDGNPVTGTATVGNGGNWSFGPLARLNPGPHTVQAFATDAAGNQSQGSNIVAFIVAEGASTPARLRFRARALHFATNPRTGQLVRRRARTSD